MDSVQRRWLICISVVLLTFIVLGLAVDFLGLMESDSKVNEDPMVEYPKNVSKRQIRSALETKPTNLFYGQLVYMKNCNTYLDCVDPRNGQSISMECRESWGEWKVCDCVTWLGIKLKWSEVTGGCKGAKGHPCVTKAQCESNSCLRKYKEINGICGKGSPSSSPSAFAVAVQLFLIVTIWNRDSLL